MTDFYIKKLQEVSEKYMEALETIKELQKENKSMAKAIEDATKMLRKLRDETANGIYGVMYKTEVLP